MVVHVQTHLDELSSLEEGRTTERCCKLCGAIVASGLPLCGECDQELGFGD